MEESLVHAPRKAEGLNGKQLCWGPCPQRAEREQRSQEQECTGSVSDSAERASLFDLRPSAGFHRERGTQSKTISSALPMYRALVGVLEAHQESGQTRKALPS